MSCIFATESDLDAVANVAHNIANESFAMANVADAVADESNQHGGRGGQKSEWDGCWGG